MEEEIPNLIRVKLFKRREDGLGFLIKPRLQKPYVAVSALVTGGLAEQSGLVQIGDLLIRVNEIDIAEKSYDDAVELLKALPVDAPVALILRGPEGYSTHLETTFQENGVPKTVRVTRKIVNAYSLVNRIRRTFSRSSSTSPSRNATGRGTSPCRYRNKEDYKKSSDNGLFVDNQCCICDIDRNFPICNGTNKKHHLKDEETQTKSNGGTPNKTSTSQGMDKLSQNDLNRSPQIVVTQSVSQSDTDTGTESDNQTRVAREATANGPNRNVSTGTKIDQDNKTYEITQNSEEISVVVKQNGDLKKENIKEKSARRNSSPNKTAMESKNHRSNSLIAANGDLHNNDEAQRRRDSFSNNLSPILQRRGSDRRGSTTVTSPKKYMKLKNMADDKLIYTDTLHLKSIEVRFN